MTGNFTPIGGAPPARAERLERRGVVHGYVAPKPPEPTAESTAAWRDGAPILLPGIFAQGVELLQHSIDRSIATLDRIRDGGRWLDECERLLDPDAPFVYSGSTLDHADAREIERLFIDAIDDTGEIIARDLTARASWIADDEADRSLRIRFSFGHESLREWLDVDDPRGPWTDRLAAAVFEECAILEHPQMLAQLAEWNGRAVRLSERIIYGNAPGGGAVFHHDADPNQRGVLFGQMHGRTAWLALPRARLAAAVAEFAPAFGPTSLDGPIGEDLWKLLNMTPAFTQHLATDGAMFVLGPGDAVVLPTPDPEHVAWHSVFALGDQPSLAHSYGVFDAQT